MKIEKVYSKLDAQLLLHMIVNLKSPMDQRVDLTPPEQWLQVSVIPLKTGAKVQAHIHQERQAETPRASITQESWLVVKGAIGVCLYDMDRTLIQEALLDEGGMLITFNGGHSMEALGEDTVVMETKNGPYVGRDFVRI